MKKSEKLALAATVAVWFAVLVCTRVRLLGLIGIGSIPFLVLLLAVLRSRASESASPKTKADRSGSGTGPRFLAYSHLLLTLYTCLLALHDTGYVRLSVDIYPSRAGGIAVMISPFAVPLIAYVIWRTKSTKEWGCCFLGNVAMSWLQILSLLPMLA